MVTNKQSTQTTKPARTVSLPIYIRDIVLAILVTGVSAFIGGYVMSENVYKDARASVHADYMSVSKDLASDGK